MKPRQSFEEIWSQLVKTQGYIPKKRFAKKYLSEKLYGKYLARVKKEDVVLKST